MGRVLTFCFLFVYHSAHALGKTFATALLAQVSLLGLMAYVVVDHLQFQFYKLMRGDFFYWLPGMGFLMSSIFRFGAKVVADFTGKRPCLAQHQRLPKTSDSWRPRTSALLRDGVLARACTPAAPHVAWHMS